MPESENTVTNANDEVSSSDLERILQGARKMESDAKKKGRDDLAEKARGIVGHLDTGESSSKDA
ncbi:hypothetical protein GCM10007304_05340 [Rhodococcoides trifolii]|uniref:Uncharacterized protein n=1 Tax=Rhodococcoides trifolii TaxID=908250 RepID=A0A917FMS7_9NOCA|nr:hypothetical protein [Rhodococcus trifolii]GGF94450.1 hypothetical protein GCM10007304_05340 [Rhodococcus trifolii]